MTGEIAFKAAEILTLYYDPVAFCLIRPWHHGAGDFIVKLDGRDVDVRLISVRGYDSSFLPLGVKVKKTLDGFICSFLDISVKMRLDKLEGMGSPVWADPIVVRPALNGFLKGIEEKVKSGEIHPDAGEGVLLSLKEMSLDVLCDKLDRQIEIYRDTDPVDFLLMRERLDDHAGELYKAIQNAPIQNL